jgi:hypothetical protein
VDYNLKLLKLPTLPKNDYEKWSRKKYFEIPHAASELLLTSAKKSAQNR